MAVYNVGELAKWAFSDQGLTFFQETGRSVWIRNCKTELKRADSATELHWVVFIYLMLLPLMRRLILPLHRLTLTISTLLPTCDYQPRYSYLKTAFRLCYIILQEMKHINSLVLKSTDPRRQPSRGRPESVEGSGCKVSEPEEIHQSAGRSACAVRFLSKSMSQTGSTVLEPHNLDVAEILQTSAPDVWTLGC